MNAKKCGRIAAVLFSGVCVILAGCGPVEKLAVPPRAAMVGLVQLNQAYEVPRPTTMVAMDAGDVQPVIQLSHRKQDLLPSEAFERVPFPLDATVSVSSTDPSATATAYPYFVPVIIPVGTQLFVSSAEIYSNSHVYHARIRTGPQANCFILLVVPGADATLPTAPDLQARDKDYLVPLAPAAAGSATSPAVQ